MHVEFAGLQMTRLQPGSGTHLNVCQADAPGVGKATARGHRAVDLFSKLRLGGHRRRSKGLEGGISALLPKTATRWMSRVQPIPPSHTASHPARTTREAQGRSGRAAPGRQPCLR